MRWDEKKKEIAASIPSCGRGGIVDKSLSHYIVIFLMNITIIMIIIIIIIMVIMIIITIIIIIMIIRFFFIIPISSHAKVRNLILWFSCLVQSVRSNKLNGVRTGTKCGISLKDEWSVGTVRYVLDLFVLFGLFILFESIESIDNLRELELELVLMSNDGWVTIWVWPFIPFSSLNWTEWLTSLFEIEFSIGCFLSTLTIKILFGW